MHDEDAVKAEMGAEQRARRRLLALARNHAWPEATVPTMNGSHRVMEGRHAWEACVRDWCPATIVMVMHSLYERGLPGLPD